MNRLKYDAIQTVGLLLIVGGVAMQYGAGPAMIAGGALMIGFSFLEALLFGRRA